MLLRITATDLVLNLFIILVCAAALFYVNKKSKKEQAIKNAWRIKNIQEDWVLYKELWLDLQEQITYWGDFGRGGGCSYITMLILDTYYEHKSDKSKMVSYTETGGSKPGVPRSIVLETLMSNFDLKPLHINKGKNKFTVEKLLEKADEEHQLIVCLLPDHVDIIVAAKKNKYIGIINDVEYDFDPNVHKLLLIEGGKYEEVGEEEDDKEN